MKHNADGTVSFYDMLENALAGRGEIFNDVEVLFYMEQDNPTIKKVDGVEFQTILPNEPLIDELGAIVFDIGFGSPEAPDILMYTKKYTYFHVQYDGADSYASVPRNPAIMPTCLPLFGGG